MAGVEKVLIVIKVVRLLCGERYSSTQRARITIRYLFRTLDIPKLSVQVEASGVSLSMTWLARAGPQLRKPINRELC